LVDSGDSRHLTRYKGVLSNLVEREASLKITLRDKSTYLVMGFGSFIFYLEYGKSIILHEVMYVSE